MTRYVMANRRAGKFREPDKRAACEAISLALNRLRPAIDIVRDNNPHVQDIGAFIDGGTLPTAGADVDSHGSHV